MTIFPFVLASDLYQVFFFSLLLLSLSISLCGVRFDALYSVLVKKWGSLTVEDLPPEVSCVPSCFLAPLCPLGQCLVLHLLTLTIRLVLR